MSLKCGIGKQNKSKHADKLPPQNELVPIKNTLVVPRVEGCEKWVKEVKRYKLPVIK